VTGDRERSVIQTFVTLADTLVDEFDVLDFLHLLVVRCVELLDAAAAGIMLADGRGGLQVLASSAERTRLLELFELQNDEGPCLECYRDGRQVASGDLVRDRDRWPIFAPEAVSTGFRAVHAFPLRLRRQVIGALNVFGAEQGPLGDADTDLGQALADVATIGLLHERAVRDSQAATVHLQTALNSRVVLEQAKGIVAEAAQLDMDAAFHLLRNYARNHNRRLTDTAEDVIRRRLTVANLAAASHPKARRQ
jgi:hypothetical protein